MVLEKDSPVSQKRDRMKLLECLRELEGRGILFRIKRRYLLAPKLNVVRGKLVTLLPGFGFVTPESGGRADIFVPGRELGGAFQGDIVEIIVRPEGRRGRPEGKVLKIIKKGKETLLGIYKESYGQPVFLPFDAPSHQEKPLRLAHKIAPPPGTIVEVNRETFSLNRVLGKPDDPGVDTQVIIRKHDLSERFSRECQEEVQAIPGEIFPADLEGRKDFRDWTTVTIDGETAQDFDDAVSVRLAKNGHFLLGVHIADVSHYVRPATALESEAFERGTSVYFPGRTLPMLPEKLSNDLCSLRPKLPRLSVSVLLEIDKRGEVLSSQFYPSIIRTAERMTYTSVYKIIEGDTEERRRYSALIPPLLLMRELASLLRNRRVQDGSLDFDLHEPELIYEGGRLHSVAIVERNEAHQLIEEFMVAANVAVASFLAQNNFPLLYRVHPKPSGPDLEELRETLAHFGLFLPDTGGMESSNLQHVLRTVKGKPEEKFINILVLRALKLAVYSPENQGHFGLAKKEYTHFTSPIRRYPDLVVHRILKRALAGEKPLKLPLDSIGLQASHQERNAEVAEKELVEWRIFRLLREKLGEELEGIVVDVSRAGLVVELDEYFVDGLLPSGDLDRIPAYRRSKRALRGRKTAKKIGLGDRIRVIIAAVDPFQRRMTLALGSNQEERGQ